jgi:hypothetical protein
MTIFSKFMASFDKREEKNYEILEFFPQDTSIRGSALAASQP